MRNKTLFMAIIATVLLFVTCTSCMAQDTDTEKTGGHGKGHSDQAGHTDEMNKRGDREMGFSQAKAIHHFRLLRDGGAIEVDARDESDTETRHQITGHLGHIANMFGEGNFKAPMLIHNQTPPGVPIMQKLEAEISYRFEESENGGRIRIKTRSVEALAAIHEFLRFQIKEHQTGDSMEVQ